MPKYTVLVKRSVQKLLLKLPENITKRLEDVMLSLEDNPRPVGYIKLKGRNAYRIREGDYRIIYEIDDEIITVTVIHLGHRKGVYK